MGIIRSLLIEGVKTMNFNGIPYPSTGDFKIQKRSLLRSDLNGASLYSSIFNLLFIFPFSLQLLLFCTLCVPFVYSLKKMITRF